MTYSDMRRKYPGKVCLCRPHLRDLKSRRVVSWQCLQIADDIAQAREALARLALEEATDEVAIISTSEEIVIEGDLAARYFRVYYGMQ